MPAKDIYHDTVKIALIKNGWQIATEWQVNLINSFMETLVQKDFEKRDEIVFGKIFDWENRQFPPGVCERFDGLDARGIEILLDLGYMKLTQTMNSTPTVESFLKFANEMQQKGYSFKFKGFIFDPRYEENQDVILEGIYYQGDFPAEVGFAFAKFVCAYQPDELALENNFLRAWWD